MHKNVSVTSLRKILITEKKQNEERKRKYAESNIHITAEYTYNKMEN